MKVKAAIRIPKAASDLESDFSSIGRELRRSLPLGTKTPMASFYSWLAPVSRK
ncbi:MAG TPA: hypothetical protein VF396_13810 [Bradyrhizobium sp.]